MDDYVAVFREWEKLKIIERVPESEIKNEGYYLPNRPVYTPNKSTKIRPVFDATAREGREPSLNDSIEKGLNLMELIPYILDRFRMYPIGISGDIEKAFLQLSITPSHRDFLRVIIRPIQRIFPLEIQSSDIPVLVTTPSDVQGVPLTQSGDTRVVVDAACGPVAPDFAADNINRVSRYGRK